MYLASVFRSIFRKNNIGTIIFFLLNAGLLIGIFSSFGTYTVITVIGVYLLSIIIALSPVGEGFLSLVAGARTMRRLDMRNKIEPILRRVYNQAMERTPDLLPNVILKVSYDPNPNAFALGRRTICVTQGLLEMPDEMIEAVLAHEIGHLALHHTDIQLVIGGGNIIMTILMVILQVMAEIFAGATAVSAMSGTMSGRRGGCLVAIVTAFLCTCFGFGLDRGGRSEKLLFSGTLFFSSRCE